jgi:hypothetical protein
MMIAKLLIELVVSTESINAYLNNVTKTSEGTDISTLINILFGKVHSIEEIRDTEHINWTS